MIEKNAIQNNDINPILNTNLETRPHHNTGNPVP